MKPRPCLLRDQRGSAATELTLLAPGLIMLMLFVVFCGRLAEARLQVIDAAHQAVRSATLARTSTQAVTDARTTADAELTQAGITCRDLAVDARIGSLLPGSTVTVTLTCRIGLSDVALLGVPGTIATQATASSVVDLFRSASPGSTP